MFQLAPWQHHSSQPFSDTDNSSSSSSSSSSSPLSSPSSSFLTPYHHPTTPSNSTTTTTTTTTPLLPISSFLSSTFSLLDEPSLTDTLPPGFLENALADEDFLPEVVEEEEQVQLYPPPLFTTTTITSSSFFPLFSRPPRLMRRSTAQGMVLVSRGLALVPAAVFSSCLLVWLLGIMPLMASQV
ncbi:hypothetical protein ACOMHN_052634 [Nucella lapillus]